jgi:hypothetical protein
MNLLDLLMRDGPWWVLVNEMDGACCEPSLDPRDLSMGVNVSAFRGPFIRRLYETFEQAQRANIHHRIGEYGRLAYDGEVLHKGLN